MPITIADEVKQLVKTQLDTIEDELVRTTLTSLLVNPFCQYRKWDYGPEIYPCWVVAEDPESDTRYVYCEEGFGPSSPWGIVFASGLEMGMDSGWFTTFEDAFYESFASAPLAIWNVVKYISIDNYKTKEKTIIAFSLTRVKADELITKLNSERSVQPKVKEGHRAEPRTQIWW